MPRRVSLQHIGESRRRRRLQRADVQFSADLAGIRYRRLRVLHERQHLLRVRQQLLTLLSQRDAAMIAIEELDVELRLEEPNARRDVGLHRRQRLRRFRDAAVPRGRGEHGEIVNVHVLSLFAMEAIQKNHYS